jgi:hypothetical protein
VQLRAATVAVSVWPGTPTGGANVIALSWMVPEQCVRAAVPGVAADAPVAAVRTSPAATASEAARPTNLRICSSKGDGSPGNGGDGHNSN